MSDHRALIAPFELRWTLSADYRPAEMGFYVRKSLRAGPFRFNLSKSGLGVSVGVPGFRVGAGPRGNYVHVGAHGVYYRASLGQRAGTRRPQPVPPVYAPTPRFDEILMEDVTGASAAELEPTGPGDLVEQLNRAGARYRIAPGLLLGLIVLFIVAPIVGAIAAVPGVPAVVWLWYRDEARRSVVAFYEVNAQPASWFMELVTAFEDLATLGGAWRVSASGRVQSTYQYKVNAGASNVVSRARADASLSGAPNLVTNIAVPTWTSGRHALHFLPDRLLVRSGASYSDVAYSQLSVAWTPQRFIEDGRVPLDAQQVDTTWRFVNVRGGPDRRFNNNRQLPVMLYGEVEIASAHGLHWLLQCSRVSSAERFVLTLSAVPYSQLAVHAGASA